MTAIRDIQDIDNPERLRYFQAIDQLRGLGIIVVGDQSSGKSSLLEGLTGLSFPIASDLCTRFATQIVLHRTPGQEPAAKASIVPGPSSVDDEDQKKRLSEFDIQMDADELSGTKFAWVLDEAAKCMGLPGSDDQDVQNLTKRFSDDILRIEISGPEEHHLSVVDVPGLFHNPTKFQTREDLAIIRRLIEDYTTDKRTIILAVMDARNNLANQEVFKMARAADPAGIRTVGIITKCDALQPGDEQGVLKIAQNSVEHLQHGWFVVRNRSTREILEGVTISERHENERRFFQQAPWNELPKDRVGVKALKPFLGQLLYEHSRREFPSLVREIEDLARETERKVEELGAPRQTAAEQRQYLTRLANRYQRNVEDALKGNYAADLGAKSPLKLRMHLRDLADQFEKDLRLKGHTSPFQHPDGSVDKDYLNENIESKAPDIRRWIQERYRDARGAELPGMINPTLLANLFREQTVQWEQIAGDYLDQVVQLVTKYAESETRRTEEDERIRAYLDSIIRSRIETTKGWAKQQLMNLLQDERGGILQTVNHYFAETREKIRQERVIARLQALGFGDGELNTINLGELTSALHLSNEDQAVNDIHDALKAYYKVAIKRFGDYVVISVVERLLGDQGALKYFSSERVGGLSDQQLAVMAAESYTTSTARVELEHRRQRYREALRVAKSV
ncbi:P-loop containing nucleoside triphosphate hydrolase protein [Trichoderma gracile]